MHVLLDLWLWIPDLPQVKDTAHAQQIVAEMQEVVMQVSERMHPPLAP
jgi:hypothetical protein